MKKKFLIHLHLYYYDQTEMLVQKLAVVKQYGDYDLFVTMRNDDSTVQSAVRTVFPDAKFIIMKNVGADVWPFVHILSLVNLDDYEYIVKVHTKKQYPWNCSHTLNSFCLCNKSWRNYLLSFLRNKNMKKCLDAFEKNPMLGMIADYRCIYDQTNGYYGELSIPYVKSILARCNLGARVIFSAGTMFVVRAKLMKKIQELNVKESEFPEFGRNDLSTTSLHFVMERLFGSVVAGQGYDIRDVHAGKIYKVFFRIENFFLKIPQNISRLCRKILSKCSRRFPKIKNPKLIMTLLVKNEADIIAQNLEYHKAMGVDGFIVTDNMSSDGTREILQKYKDKNWILEIIDEPAQDYMQADWVHRMNLLAIDKYRADWIIDADADEFWHAKSGNLKNELSLLQTDKLFVKYYQMLDKGDGDWINYTTRVIADMPKDLEWKLVQENRLGVIDGQPLHTIAIPSHKCVVRAVAYVKIMMGNHDAKMKGKSKSKHFSDDIMIYHFSIRGIRHFYNKMMTGGGALEKNTKLNKSVGAHRRYYYIGIKNGSLDIETEYKKFTGMLAVDEIKENGLTITDTTILDFFKKRNENV